MNFTTMQYQFSQKYQLGTTIIFTFIGIILGVILGILYSVISSVSPMIIIDICLLFVLILVLTKINEISCKLAKIRNAKVNMLMAFIISLFTYYSSIVTFEIILFDLSPYAWLELFISPTSVVDMMVNLIIPYREITIYKRSAQAEISGIFLVLLYIIEFLFFIVPPIFKARKIKDYYCEDCQSWYKKLIFLSFSDDKLISNISNSSTGDYAVALSQVKFYREIKEIIKQLDPKSNEDVGVLQYQYCQCSNCRNNSILNVIKMKKKKEKKGITYQLDSKSTLVKDTYINSRTDQVFSL